MEITVLSSDNKTYHLQGLILLDKKHIHICLLMEDLQITGF